MLQMQGFGHKTNDCVATNENRRENKLQLQRVRTRGERPLPKQSYRKGLQRTLISGNFGQTSLDVAL